MSFPDPTDPNNDVPSGPTERRRDLRFPFTATVEALETETGTKVVGRASDLSLGGCYVDTFSPFPVGTQARVRLLREHETFEAQAKVIYSLIGIGMGLAFVSAHPQQVPLLQKWLLEISGQSVPAEDLPSHDASETAPAAKTQTPKNVVLSDLIMTLVQNDVLTQGEGNDLLRKLFR